MKKKLLATMAAIPLLGAFGGTGVLAAVTNEQPITGDNQNGINNPMFQKDVEVLINTYSEFTVVIPKQITLEKNKNYVEGYTVTVNGDIAGNEYVEVLPQEVKGIDPSNASTNGNVNIEMTQAGKDDIIAEVVQANKKASSADLFGGTTKSLTGTVTATGVTAGSWEGHFNFDINLKVDPTVQP